MKIEKHTKVQYSHRRPWWEGGDYRRLTTATAAGEGLRGRRGLLLLTVFDGLCAHIIKLFAHPRLHQPAAEFRVDFDSAVEFVL
jgi:hypothetical protein